MVTGARKRPITRRRLKAIPAPKGVRDSQRLVSDIAPLLERIAVKAGVGFSMSEGDRKLYESGRYSRLMAQDHRPLLEDLMDVQFGDGSVEIRLLSLDEHDEKLTNMMKMAMLGELAAGLAHDFRNSLTVLHANMPELRKAAIHGHASGRSVDEIIEEMQGAIDMATDMCNRVQSMGMQTKRRKLISGDVASVVESSVSMAMPRVKEAWSEGKRVRIENNLSDPLYAKMVTSEVQMAVMNILFNAVRYCGLGGTKGIITINGFRNADRIVLAIGNNGPEIAPEIQDTLLTKPLTTACVHGYGLYTAVSNLRTFGGDLSFTTGPARTVFRITLEASEGNGSMKDDGKVNRMKKDTCRDVNAMLSVPASLQ